MFHKKTALSWITTVAVAALVIAACSPAATPAVPTDTAVAPSAVPSDTPAATQAVIPNSGATAAATTAPGGGSSATILVTANSSLGQILTDANGKTLYAFTKDQADTSNCTGSCATNWPPLAVVTGTTPTAGDGITVTLGTLTRADGTLQVTVNHMPVYTSASDVNPGDANGQGKGGVWFVLDASGNLVNTMSGTPMAPASTAAAPADTAAAPADTAAAPAAPATTYP